ncbi:MAG: hypothetical protein IJV72_04080 [Clostridia bacterium]|nr:hypothetical protein [Clostridia bacterium]
MKVTTLNGIWDYRIGKGALSKINVPFSAAPVGHSECSRTFDLEERADRIFLKFDGITYGARATLNGTLLPSMIAYCEYSFDVTEIVKEKDNFLLVELEDITPAFGPVDGWENYGGIIRDVSLIYSDKNYIEDVFFHSTLKNGYRDADFVVETKANCSRECVYEISLSYGGKNIVSYIQAQGETKEISLSDVNLWTLDEPCLYQLKVRLLEGERECDTYECNVGFREISHDAHRILFNGEPTFIKGVCKHEMFGDSGHCPTPEQIEYDLRTIKETGCNYIRLVHYPHNKLTLDIADRLGIMVSEEPGLWWSDTSNPEVSSGSLEALKRTILRDRNHASIAFWLCFNECRFTEQYLIDSANTCRKYDPYRMVSGANCMSDEDTKKYFNICNFDFYTQHPYSRTFDRSMNTAKTLTDKPLIFTEWGGCWVYDNPALFAHFMDEMYRLYEANSDEGALAGCSYWYWAELHEYNRGIYGCVDGILREGLVDKYRKPTMIYETFRKHLNYHAPKNNEYPLWVDIEERDISLDKMNRLDTEDGQSSAETLERVCKIDLVRSPITRKKALAHGPVLTGYDSPLYEVPKLLCNGDEFRFPYGGKGKILHILGNVSIYKGYPLGGEYGRPVAEVVITYADGSRDSTLLLNGVHITTVFGLKGPSRINPVAETTSTYARFGYDVNFEQFVIKRLALPLKADTEISEVTLRSMNNSYKLLTYGIFVE